MGGTPLPQGTPRSPGGFAGDPAAAGGVGARGLRGYSACLPWHSRLEHCAGFHQSPLWQWQMLQSSTFTSMPAGMMVVPAKQLGPAETRGRNEYTLFFWGFSLIKSGMSWHFIPPGGLWLPHPLGLWGEAGFCSSQGNSAAGVEQVPGHGTWGCFKAAFGRGLHQTTPKGPSNLCFGARSYRPRAFRETERPNSVHTRTHKISVHLFLVEKVFQRGLQG